MNYEELLEEAFRKIIKKETKDRFQIPQVEVEIQGARTLIKNFKKIVEYLKRDNKHLAKYLMLSLASSGSIERDVLVLNLKTRKETIQQKLEEYIKKFVFCRVCGEPDTKLLEENDLYFIECDACGAKYVAK